MGWNASCTTPTRSSRTASKSTVCRIRTAFARIIRREQDDPLRRVHAAPRDETGHEAAHRAFRRVNIAVPALEVDTTDGYRPPFGQILSFVAGRRG